MDMPGPEPTSRYQSITCHHSAVEIRAICKAMKWSTSHLPRPSLSSERKILRIEICEPFFVIGG